jgi:hypothetical protein
MAGTGISPNIDAGFVTSMLGKVFGFNSPIYVPYGIHWHYLAKPFPGVKAVGRDDIDRLSMLGTPVIGSFWIEGSSKQGGKYKSYDKFDGKLKDAQVSDFEFPVATMVSFKQSKLIGKTMTSGGGGSVKNIFGMADWDITMQGIIFEDTSRTGQTTVEEQMYALQKLNEVAGALNIGEKAGSLFFNRGISRIVIDDLEFIPQKGYPSIMPYTLKATSDEDILMEV